MRPDLSGNLAADELAIVHRMLRTLARGDDLAAVPTFARIVHHYVLARQADDIRRTRPMVSEDAALRYAARILELPDAAAPAVARSLRNWRAPAERQSVAAAVERVRDYRREHPTAGWRRISAATRTPRRIVQRILSSERLSEMPRARRAA